MLDLPRLPRALPRIAAAAARLGWTSDDGVPFA